MPITSHGGVNGAGQSGSVSVAAAAAAEPGDFVTACFLLRHGTQPVPTPAGWTSQFSDVSNTNRLQLFTRICTGFGADGGGTEPSTSFNWNATAGTVSYWVIARTWAGVDTANPFIVAPNGGTGTTATAVTAPAMSPGSAGLALWWWSVYYGTGLQTGPKTVTPPAGLDQQSSVLRAAQTLGYVGIQGSLVVPSGSTGTKIATATATPTSWRTMGLVLRELSSGPDPARGGDHFHTLAA